MAIEDEMLIAWLDGELSEIEARRIETALAGDPVLAARVEAQRRLRATLAARYGPVADEAVPERFRTLLEPTIVPLATARADAARPRIWRSAIALAATLVLGLFIGRALPQEQGLVASLDEGLVARGALDSALQTQLASSQPAGAATRVGITFARADGSLCRTFDGAELAGIACRANDSWRLVVVAAGGGGQRTEYRQAGIGAAMVPEAAQAMMAGEPLDAADERRAFEAGWRSAR